MRIKKVKSSEKQNEVQEYGNKVNVYLYEREIINEEQNQEVQVEYEYTVVSLDNRYAGDVVQVAKDILRNSLVLSARKARLVLLNIGKLADVESAILLMDEPNKSMAQVEWEYATEIRRNHPFVEVLGVILNLSEDQVDMLFIKGAE